MSGTKLHIDKLFSEGLKNFSLLVSNKDMEAIDDKSNIFKEQEIPDTESAFKGFEIDIDENDWLSTKAKLANEKSIIAQDNFMSVGFNEFELDIKPDDWTRTYQKLKAFKKRRVAYWWLSAGMLALALGLFLTFRHYQGKALDTTVISENVKPEIGPSTSKKLDKIEKSAALESEKFEETQKNSHNNSEAKKPNLNVSGIDANKNTILRNKSPQHSKAEIKNSNKVGIRNHNGTQASGNNRNTDNADLESTLLRNTQPEVKGLAPEENTEKTKAFLTDDKDKEVVNTIPEETKGEIADVEEKLNEKPEVKPDGSNNSLTLPGPADSNRNKKQDNIQLPLSKVPQRKFYIGLVNQLGSTFRNLDRQNNVRYNEIRNSSEKPFTQWTYGMEFGIQKSKRQFSIGIQSTNQTWTSSYQYSYRIFDSLPVYGPAPDKVLLGYLLVRPRDTSIGEEAVIKINKMQIPFEFSQFFTLSPKMNFMATLGGTIGITTRTEGSKILNPVNNYLYYYSALKDNERKVSLAPSLSIGVQYQLNKYFMIQGAAFGNYSMTNRFKNNYPAKDYPYSIGGSLKLLYFIK